MTTRANAADLRAPRPSELAVLAAVLVALVALDSDGRPLRAALVYAREPLAAGEVWRLFTAHFVHEDLRHVSKNVGGLVLLWLLYRDAARPGAWLGVLAASALAIDLGLYATAPGVEWYLGASGVLHGAWAAGAVFTLARSRLEGVVMLSILAIKLTVEQVLGPVSGDGGGLTVVTAAHGFGALGGFAAAAVRVARDWLAAGRESQSRGWAPTGMVRNSTRT